MTDYIQLSFCDLEKMDQSSIQKQRKSMEFNLIFKLLSWHISKTTHLTASHIWELFWWHLRTLQVPNLFPLAIFF